MFENHLPGGPRTNGNHAMGQCTMGFQPVTGFGVETGRNPNGPFWGENHPKPPLTPPAKSLMFGKSTMDLSNSSSGIYISDTTQPLGCASLTFVEDRLPILDPYGDRSYCQRLLTFREAVCQ
jgi:hypothetical protein